jgi:hypothetical protein
MHRKLTLVISILLITITSVNAQFKKGMRMAGANIGSAVFNSGSSDVTFPTPTQGYTSKITSFGVNISPSMGWFISDDIVVGILISINPFNDKTRYKDDASGNTFQQDKSNSLSAGMGGFARKYFNSKSSFMPFGQLTLNFGFNSKTTSGFFYGGSGSSVYKTTYNGKSSGGTFGNATLSLGMTKLLNPNTGLDFFAGYSFSSNKNTFKTTTLRDDGNNGTIDLTTINQPTSKYTNSGFSVGVGFQVFLDKRK